MRLSLPTTNEAPLRRTPLLDRFSDADRAAVARIERSAAEKIIRANCGPMAPSHLGSWPSGSAMPKSIENLLLLFGAHRRLPGVRTRSGHWS
jgi:hypothetical protein